MPRGKATVPLSTKDRRVCMDRFGALPLTDAKRVLPATADERSWLEARLSSVGASELAAVMGMSPFVSPFALWWRKKMGWHTEATEDMLMGRKLEAVIGEVFAERVPEVAVFRANGALWRHPKWSHMTFSPDFIAVQRVPGKGVIKDRLVIKPVECKSDQGGEGWGKPQTDAVPYHHKMQIWDQCEGLNSSGGFLARLNGKRFSWYYVPYTKEDQARMAAEYAPSAENFMASIESGEPPPLDGSRSTTEVLERLYDEMDVNASVNVGAELSMRFRVALALKRDGKTAYDAVCNEMRAAMGSARFAVDPDGVKLLRRDIFDRHEFISPATTVDRVMPA